jgi:hypothetical protein
VTIDVSCSIFSVKKQLITFPFSVVSTKSARISLGSVGITRRAPFRCCMSPVIHLALLSAWKFSMWLLGRSGREEMGQFLEEMFHLSTIGGNFFELS